jgi:hypothetical protein
MRKYFVILCLTLFPSLSYAEIVAKPVFCEPSEYIAQLLTNAEEIGILGGTNIGLAPNRQQYQSVIGFYINTQKDTWTIVEWIGGEIACVLGAGRSIEFDSEKMTPKHQKF